MLKEWIIFMIQWRKVCKNSYRFVNNVNHCLFSLLSFDRNLGNRKSHHSSFFGNGLGLPNPGYFQLILANTIRPVT